MTQPSVPEVNQATTPELAAYYADRRLLWRNITLIGICNMGWFTVMGIVTPLMTLRLLEMGVHEGPQATIQSINGMAVSFLVLYFSWKSDHTASRLGRRKPYLFLAAPFIIGSIALFPFFDYKSVLVGLMLAEMLFMDIKLSTFPLLNIDCVPRNLLGRMNSVFTIAGGVVGFAAAQLAGHLLAVAEWFPYIFGAAVMTLTTFAAYWIKEPPVQCSTTETFKLWSTFKVAARDKRIFILMLAVALIISYQHTAEQWTWFWAKQTLHIEKADIYKAFSWGNLLNVIIAYPVGWLIDRWGGWRIVLTYWLCAFACFCYAMTVHDQSGLIVLLLAQTVAWPLFQGVDITVYKSADPAEVGSITSTSACIRSAYRASLGFSSGWLIQLAAHNYRLGFIVGIIMSTLGLALFFLYRWTMTRTPPTTQPAAQEQAAAQA
jgi:MFS family permease